MRVRAGRLDKAVIARDIAVDGRRSRSTSTPCCCACGPRSARATATASTASSAPRPSCSSRSHGDAVRVAPAGRHRAAHRRPRDRRRMPPPQLVASTKNQVEHRVVIDMIHDTLLPWCSYLDWEAEPSVVTVANVQHLGTRMEGRLSDRGRRVLELVRALAPTPAARRLAPGRRAGAHRRGRGLRPRAATAGRRLGRRRAATARGPWRIRCAELERRPTRRSAGRRRRHRRRQRPARRAGRDAGQVPGDAVGHRAAVTVGRRTAVARRAIATTAAAATAALSSRWTSTLSLGRSAPGRDACPARRTAAASSAAVSTVVAGMPMGRGERDEVGAVRRAEQLLEALGGELVVLARGTRRCRRRRCRSRRSSGRARSCMPGQ